MSDKITMDYLAKQLNISKTTVSKALNSCPGISASTRDMVVKTAELHGYKPSRQKSSVAVILPSVPSYFWGIMRKKLSGHIKASKVQCNFYVYPNLRDCEGALHCIEQALSKDVSVIILACPNHAQIKQRLESVSNKCLIILIEEFCDINNTFFVGENSLEQGYNLGSQYAKNYPSSGNFAILHATDFHTEKMRIDGFSNFLTKHQKNISCHLYVSSKSKLQASSIARQLADLPQLPDCIFCPSGNVLCACNAVKKLKTKKQIHCIGFDLYTNADNSQNKHIITHVLLQDIETQSQKAWEYAERFLNYSMFPDCKKIYVDDVFYNL